MSDKSVVENLNRISESTGFSWLNAIPAHWRLQQLRYLADIRFSNVDKKSDDNELLVKLCNYTDVYYNRLITSDLDFMEATATQEEIEKFGLRAGDVLVTKDSESWDDIAIPAYVPETLPGVICGYHLALIRPDDIQLGRYLAWVFASSAIAYQFNIAASGITRYGLSQQAIKDAWFPIPPRPEQRAIADFLDRETAQIDALIARKQRLLELLAERRQALITHAVTKGLDPDMPMKDSGVEWLGEIPEDWQVKKLKRIARIRYGLGQPPRETANGLPLIRATNISNGKITTEGLVYVDPNDVPMARDAFLSEGEIIVVRSGAYTGDSAILPEYLSHSVIGYDLVVTVVSAESRFVAWHLLSPIVVEQQFKSNALRAAQPHLNAEDLGSTLLVIPPLSTQQEISTYLEHKTSSIDHFVSKVNEAIGKLRERRVALINEAVTGKLKVTE